MKTFSRRFRRWQINVHSLKLWLLDCIILSLKYYMNFKNMENKVRFLCILRKYFSSEEKLLKRPSTVTSIWSSNICYAEAINLVK